RATGTVRDGLETGNTRVTEFGGEPQRAAALRIERFGCRGEPRESCYLAQRLQVPCGGEQRGRVPNGMHGAKLPPAIIGGVTLLLRTVSRACARPYPGGPAVRVHGDRRRCT